MSNIDKQWLRQLDVDAKELAIIKRYTKGIEAQKKFIAAMTPALVLALLDELEVATDACNGWQKKFSEADERLEAAEKRIAELPGQKRLIGWRMADYTDETADPALAKNWATAVDVLPIFEGDVNTKISSAAAGKGEAS
ncbi:ead/Ea22-like family protein [Enterobacter cancerogenus]|uniref:ead/Ea22-like family protein n=1 Tax=Enterobacter cancerogenus TaxID=69218 RepID=UPI003076734A